MQEKLYLNGVPVYRTQVDSEVEYILFENDDSGSVIRMLPQLCKIEEYKIVLAFISNMMGKEKNYELGISVRKEKI